MGAHTHRVFTGSALGATSPTIGLSSSSRTWMLSAALSVCSRLARDLISAARQPRTFRSANRIIRYKQAVMHNLALWRNPESEPLPTNDSMREVASDRVHINCLEVE